MSTLQKIFKTFSRSPSAAAQGSHDITATFRNRVWQWCDEELFDSYHDDKRQFFLELHRVLRMRHGTDRLASSTPTTTYLQDLAAFWHQCPGDHFLDIVEDVCRLADAPGASVRGNGIVEAINDLFAADALPYALTKFVYEQRPAGAADFPFRRGVVVTVTAHPQIILREVEITHKEMIEPTLELLANAAFKNANDEFREALHHYRKAEYGDCLTKCGSALESVMKIICDRRGWLYDANRDSAGRLVKIMVSNTSLGTHFEPLLISVASLRNKLSKSHGAGSTPRIPPRHLARYVVNSTASAILLLAEETGEI